MRRFSCKRLTALLLSLVLLLSALPAVGAATAESPFQDVRDPDRYYYEAVVWAYENGITAGVSQDRFGVGLDCTRAQMVTFLYAAAGSPSVEGLTNPFADVQETDYFYAPVLWAADREITAGRRENCFDPEAVCTRGELVTFLYAAARRPAVEGLEAPFEDLDPEDYYRDAVLWAYNEGITAGLSAAVFGPQEPCKREQAVTFFHAAGRYELVVEATVPSASNTYLDKYGNTDTDLTGEAFFARGFNWGDLVTVSFLDVTLDLPLVPSYSYVDSGAAGIFVKRSAETGGPVGRVFLAINMGNFAETYGLAYKTVNEDKTYFWTPQEGVEFPVTVTFSMKEAGGYLGEMILRSLDRTNNREDYPALTDEEFANFRRVTTTGMGDHLYRGTTPISPVLGRNTYADAALEAAGATVIMNLANGQAEAEAFEGFADTYYAGQNVIYLGVGIDFFSEEFRAGLTNGLRFFAANPGVYYVHCIEGKDRTGFVCALLECLMGASLEEVAADYLKTYENFYTVVDGVQHPLSQETLEAIVNTNILKSLKTAFEVEDLASADLAAEAEAYIAALGLTPAEIAALKTNLGN